MKHMRHVVDTRMCAWRHVSTHMSVHVSDAEVCVCVRSVCMRVLWKCKERCVRAIVWLSMCECGMQLPRVCGV